MGFASRTCVLVVDEDASFCIDLSASMGRFGIDVRATSDPAEAIAFARSERPALILLAAGLDGGAERTAELIALVYPAAAIVLTASDEMTAASGGAPPDGALAVIRKPLTADQARQLAEATLAVPAGAGNE